MSENPVSHSSSSDSRQHSERSFRLWEQDLINIVDNWPRPTVIYSELSQETMKARLRDAWNAVIQHPEWKTYANRSRLKEIWKDKVVVNGDSSHFIIVRKFQNGENIKPRTKSEIGTEEQPLVPSTGFTTHRPTAQESLAWITLLSLGKITGPVRITGLSPNDTFLSDPFVCPPNIEIFFNPTTSEWTLL